MYANDWSLPLSVAAVTDYVEYYKGVLPGDSGGPIVRTYENAEKDLLCGVASGMAVTVSDYFLDLFADIESRYAAVDASETEAWLNPFVFDQRGNIHGTCSPKLRPAGTPIVLAEETDSDGDMIPDACDPCVTIPDPTYRINGIFGLSDMDGDGTPDVCDTCPTLFGVPQTDSDGDGLGDACDPCGNSGVSDLRCCNFTQPNPCSGAGVCVPSVPGSPGGCGVGFSGRCSEPIDEDQDGRPNSCDKCPVTKDPFQGDADGDGLGDVCDGCDGSAPLRLFPELKSLATATSKVGLIPCDPTNSLADQNCQNVTLSTKSRCVVIPSLTGGPPTGVCSESGPDTDGDGVWDACDNCKYVPNASQENCNIEAEMVANPSAFPYVGDACDRTPCAYTRALTSTLTEPVTGVGLVETTPLVLPPNATVRPPAAISPPLPYPFSSSSPPLSTVGNSFCACSANNVAACRDSLVGGCTIDPTSYSISVSQQWVKPSVKVASSSGGPVASAELQDLPTGNASSQSFPLLDQADPSLVEWDTNLLSGGNTILPAPQPSSEISVCKDGKGVRGVLWTSVREVDAINLTGNALDNMRKFSSHYEPSLWGSLPTCVQAQTPPLNLETQPCFFCKCPDCGFLSVANFHIYINPGDLKERLLVASDGLFSRTFGKLPFSLDEAALPEARSVAASDWFHTTQPGPDFATVLADGTRVTSAVQVQEEGPLRSWLPLRRTQGAAPQGEQDDTEVADFQAMAEDPSGPAPAPRLEAALALSKRHQALFLAGGKSGNLPLNDLWRYDLRGQSWSPMVLQGNSLGNVLAMTFHGPEDALYVLDEKKVGWFHVGRLLRIDPHTGATRLVGVWPRLRAFDQLHLMVAQSGDLVLSASRTKGKKGAHLVALLSASSPGQWKLRWTLGGVGALSGPAVLTREGLTRPFLAPELTSKRFTPTGDLPKKTVGSVGDCL
jgi:hypothetical protein